ncbi:MAG: DsrE family protein [Gemmatimonadota bacterium]|nr:MAG: DsrE family protein [Gemmatimonadota bacterium]
METSKLGVVWTSGDRDVALKMVFMYTLNAKRRSWFDDVRLVVWGPSAKLLSVDEELQEEVARMKEAGVELVACKACSDSYGISEELEALGVEVKYMGVELSDMLKQDWKVVTF